MHKAVWIVAALVGFSSFSVPGARAAYELEINKSKRTLVVKNGDKIAKKYAVATGTGGSGHKARVGDLMTPVGDYRIVELKNSSRFHFFMLLDYPNVKDAFYGLKHKTISMAQYDDVLSALKKTKPPLQNTRLGGRIGIHGIGVETVAKRYIHKTSNWTKGCIALTNAEINELRRYVQVGTKVRISD